MDKDDKSILDQFEDPQSRNYAFDLLVKKYQERLYWHIRRMVIDHEDANDVVQDVFIKVWNNLGSFRRDSNLYTWLYRIATNETLTFLNKKKRRYFIPWTDVENELTQNLKASKDIEGEAIIKKLQEAILTLPRKQRVVFNLRYYDEMSYKEMSEVLATSEGALKASYHHAVKKIEKFMKGD